MHRHMSSEDVKMDKELKKKEKSTISWIWDAIGRYRITSILLCVMSLVSTGLMLLNVLYLRNLIDAASSSDREALIRNAIAMGIIAFMEIFFQIFERYVRDTTSYRIAERIQERMFTIILKKDFVSVSSKHSGEWMNRMILDIDGVASSATSTLPGIVGAAAHLIGAGILIIEIEPLFLLLAAAGGAALVTLNYVLKEPIKKRHRDMRDSIGAKNIFMRENLSHLLIIKAFDREDIIASNARDKVKDVEKKKESKLRLMLMKSGVQNIAMRAAYVGILIYCAVSIFHGHISYGSSVMLLRLLSQISTPLIAISTYITSFFEVIVSVERLSEVEAFEDDPSGEVRDDEEIHRFYRDEFQDMHFTDAAFAYHDAVEDEDGVIPTVFSHVDLTIPKNSVVAFTGITGSGKSTFFKLLMSFFKLKEGTKKIRTKDGRELDLDSSFRRLFAFVPQGHQLMSGTIRDMVTFGSPDAKEHDEEIWKVLEVACAKDFVEKLPEKLDTEIKEKGAGLSEGQMQRIAIARALYSGRPVLLLDEATSALDEATERDILEHLKNMTDHTILFITHRPNGLSICDREVHINGNRVILRDLNKTA